MRSVGEAIAALKAHASESIGRIADDVDAKVIMRMASDPRIQARWMSYCGADEPSGIDYSNPCVRIELAACSPSLLSLAARDGEAFIERTACDRETFMRYYDQSAEAP